MSKNNTKPKQKFQQSAFEDPAVTAAEPLYKKVPTLSERVDEEILAEYGNLSDSIPALLSAILRELVMNRIAR